MDPKARGNLIKSVKARFRERKAPDVRETFRAYLLRQAGYVETLIKGEPLPKHAKADFEQVPGGWHFRPRYGRTPITLFSGPKIGSTATVPTLTDLSNLIRDLNTLTGEGVFDGILAKAQQDAATAASKTPKPSNPPKKGKRSSGAKDTEASGEAPKDGSGGKSAQI